MVEALGSGKVSLHQVAAAMGFSEADLPAWVACHAVRVHAPASLLVGDIIVATQVAAATTVIRVEKPYRRPAGEDRYSAEVSIRGRRRPLDEDEVAGWFPVDVLRSGAH